MILLCLLVALVAQHLVPPPAAPRLDSLVGRLCLAIARRMDAGDVASGRVALGALLVVTVFPVALLAWLAAALHPVMVLLLDAAVLYASLRFLETVRPLSARDERGDPAETGAGLRIGNAIAKAHHGTFALLFWYAVLPGPIGPALHVVLRQASELWSLGEPGEARAFGQAAVRVFRAVDWLPQRATALSLAVVGNFEDALFCWRSQGREYPANRDAVVLAAGAGAMGVTLGPSDDRLAGEAAALGSGEPAREEAFASLEGLLWRALVLWGVVLAVVAAITA